MKNYENILKSALNSTEKMSKILAVTREVAIPFGSEGTNGGTSMVNILVVDDQKALRKNLAFYLKSQGYEVATAESGEEAIEKIAHVYYDIVIADYKMGQMSGYDLMKAAKAVHPSTLFIIITAYGDISLAVDVMRDGAADFIPKPFEYAAILDRIEKILKKRQAGVTSDNDRYNQFIAQSQKMKDVIDLSAKAAQSDVPVFIEGENGTGKELVARMIHKQSRRSWAGFTVIECQAFDEENLEAEIFGNSESGQKDSALERANGGTLFFRDMNYMGSKIQSKLLRFIREGAFTLVDSAMTQKSDVRIIASATSSLKQLVSEGVFRDDLYYQLNVINIYVPPLRARIADIFPLVEYFLARYSAQNSKDIKAISPDVLAWMRTYEWPGNVRELENIISRACALATCDILDESLVFTLPDDRPATEEPSGFLNITLKDNQKTLILKALKQNNGNFSRTASQLGISRTTLWRRLKKFKIDGVAVK